MGVLARELDRLGGEVRGVKPRSFLKYEPTEQAPDVGENEIVADLHSQKVRMTQLSDAFLFLPGGFGTFEEFGTYRMWGKLGKPRF
jgi:predicted Rossmann-fold nucleotide-binding protein